MAVPTIVGAGAFAASAATATPGLPAGIAANDILLLFVETENEPVTLSDAQGFVQLGTPVGTGTAGATTASRITVFWKRATGADNAPTVADAGDHVACRIIAFRGCITTGDPWDGTPTWTVDANSDTSIVADGPTTTVADCLVVIGAANVIDTNTAQTLSYSNANLANLGPTGFGDNTNQGSGGGFNVGTGEKAAAGAVGGTTITYNNATQKSVAVIALKPEPALPPSISAASVSDSGRNWTAPHQDIAITFSEAVTKLGGSYLVGDTIPGLTVQIAGGAELAVTYQSGEDTASWVVRVASLVKNGQSVVLDYVQATGELVAVDDSQELQAYTNLAVTNNLTKRIRRVITNNAGTALNAISCKTSIHEYDGGNPANANWMLLSDKAVASTDAAGLLDLLYTGPTAIDGLVYLVVYHPDAAPEESLWWEQAVT